MPNTEAVINIEDVYYDHDEVYTKNLLENSNSNYCYRFLRCFLCCFL